MSPGPIHHVWHLKPYNSQNSLQNPRRALQRPLGVAVPQRPNVALWQLTADLPVTLELAFLGGAASDSSAGVEQQHDFLRW